MTAKPRWEDLPVEEWEIATGQVRRGKRCTAHSKNSGGERCARTAREGFAVCGSHGAGYEKRERDGTRQSKLSEKRITEVSIANLRADINKLADNFSAVQGARRAAGTTEAVLLEIARRLEEHDAGGLEVDETSGRVRVQFTIQTLLDAAAELSRASKQLADIESKESFTWEDLVTLSKSVATLFMDLSRYVPEEDLDAYLKEAEQGLRRSFRGTGGGGVPQAEPDETA